jgi:hypothetical protein
MQPQDLHPESFAQYPPAARALAVQHLGTLRQLPLSLLPVLLREVIDADWRFPAEQDALRRQLSYLGAMSPAQLRDRMAPFASIRLPDDLSRLDWVNRPEAFTEALTAALWSTRQMDAYRAAAREYQATLEAALPAGPPAMRRLGMVVVGQGVAQAPMPLFRKLRPHGVLFTRVRGEGGLGALLGAARQRAQQHPAAYAHWYIDGGVAQPGFDRRSGVAQTSYAGVAPAAMRELERLNGYVQSQEKRGGANAEQVRSFMAALRPEDLGMEAGQPDPTLRHFELSVLTEGAGAQIFSTTFVQWAAREALRRAQPLTLLARFAPRQQMAPMNELLARDPMRQATDPVGSLLDADMGAYYTWINLQRLSGAEQSAFLAWWEGQGTAVAIAPSLPRGTVSDQPTTLGAILNWMS